MHRQKVTPNSHAENSLPQSLKTSHVSKIIPYISKHIPSKLTSRVLAGPGAEQMCGHTARGTCLLGSWSVEGVVWSQKVRGEVAQALLCALDSLKVHLQ